VGSLDRCLKLLLSNVLSNTSPRGNVSRFRITSSARSSHSSLH
jgi:hypothetical protein